MFMENPFRGGLRGVLERALYIEEVRARASSLEAWKTLGRSSRYSIARQLEKARPLFDEAVVISLFRAVSLLGIGSLAGAVAARGLGL